MKITKIMKILECHQRIFKKPRIPYENYENHENYKIKLKNAEKSKKKTLENHENYENHRIPCENQQKALKSKNCIGESHKS